MLNRTLVVGATGRLGSEIVRLLRVAGVPVRALVRSHSDERRRAQLGGWGAELRTADLTDRDSLDAACRGIDCVVSTASAAVPRREGDSIATVDEAGQLDLVAAALQSGVRQFVFVSFPLVNVNFALQDAKRRVEARLADKAGMAATVIQPAKFCEVWLSPLVGFDPLNGKVRVHGSGEARVSWISLHDVARAVVRVVESGPSGPFAGRVVPLGGPQALSPLEVVGIFEELGGRKIDVDFVPRPALEEALRAAPGPFQQTYAALALAMTFGQEVDPRLSRELVPRPLTTVKAYAAQTLKIDPVAMQ